MKRKELRYQLNQTVAIIRELQDKVRDITPAFSQAKGLVQARNNKPEEIKLKRERLH